MAAQFAQFLALGTKASIKDLWRQSARLVEALGMKSVMTCWVGSKFMSNSNVGFSVVTEKRDCLISKIVSFLL